MPLPALAVFSACLEGRRYGFLRVRCRCSRRRSKDFQT
jgi:hypothetical protein